MAENNRNSIPLEPIHLSKIIQDEMDARGWSRSDLANRMGMDRCAISKLAIDLYFEVGPDKPNMRIGEDMAQQMSVAFGISKEFFLNIEHRWLADMSVLHDGYPTPKQESE